MSTLLLKRNTLALTTYKICMGGFATGISVIVLLWQSCGLSYMQIFGLQSFFALMLIILEVPSGYCADLWGRKKALIVSAVLLTAANAIFIGADRLCHFVIAELLFAVALSLQSGSDSALYFDTLLLCNKQESFPKAWGSIHAVELWGFGVLTLGGGFLFAHNQRLPFVVSSVVTSLAIGAALLLHEPPRSKPLRNKGYWSDLQTIVRTSFVQYPALKTCLLRYAGVSAFVSLALWYYQPFFTLCRVEVRFNGLLFFLFNGVAALAARATPLLDRNISPTRAMAGHLVLLAGSFVAMSVLHAPWAVTVILIHQAIRGWLEVSTQARINAMVCPETRATLLSIVSMAGRSAYALILPLYGFIADQWSPQSSLQCAAVGCIVVLAGFVAYYLLHYRARVLRTIAG